VVAFSLELGDTRAKAREIVSVLWRLLGPLRR
jgi:hypothetical protein